MDELKRHVEIDALLSYYEPLLTDKQARIMRYYYGDNYTLSEIAELTGTSRNAVHDHIKKTEKKLREYEKRLGLKRKSEERRRRIDALKDEIDDRDILERLEELKEVD